jgi:hypothetical protein
MASGEAPVARIESRDQARENCNRTQRGERYSRGVHGAVGALLASLALCAGLSGCGLAAAPCRVASAGLKIVPVVGHVAAAPTDACAAVIDP